MRCMPRSSACRVLADGVVEAARRARHEHRATSAILTVFMGTPHFRVWHNQSCSCQSMPSNTACSSSTMASCTIVTYISHSATRRVADTGRADASLHQCAANLPATVYENPKWPAVCAWSPKARPVVADTCVVKILRDQKISRWLAQIHLYGKPGLSGTARSRFAFLNLDDMTHNMLCVSWPSVCT